MELSSKKVSSSSTQTVSSTQSSVDSGKDARDAVLRILEERRRKAAAGWKGGSRER